MNYLERAWEKPEHVRKAIAAGSVVVIMAIILGVWVMTFSLPSFSEDQSAPLAEATQQDQPSPFSLLWELSKQTLQSLF